MPSEFSKLLQELQLHVDAADRALERSKSSDTTILNMDFSIFQPFVYSTNRSTSPNRFGNYDFVSREIMKNISNYKRPAKFKLAVSDLAFLELLDHTDKRGTNALIISESRKASDQLSQLARVGANITIEDQFRTGRQLASQLEKAVSLMVGSPQQLKQRELIAMLRNGVISGLGDFFTHDDLRNAQNGGVYFREVLEKIDRFRRSGGESDSDGDDFNKKIDAWNITLSRNLHHAKVGHIVEFLGPPRLREIYGKQAETLSCSALSPFMELKAFQFADPDKNLRDEAESLLSLAAERSARILKRVGGVTSIEQCLSADSVELAQVKKMLVDYFYFTDDAEDIQMRSDLKALVDELASDPRKIRDRYKEAADSHQEDARTILDAVPQILSDDFLKEYELLSSKRIKHLIKKYT